MRKYALLPLALFLFSCSSATEKPVCEAGRQLECSCPGSVTGYQTCNDDGSGWGECNCSCVKNCTGRECGEDPVCGESCGTCGLNSTCSESWVCECDFVDCEGTCCGDGQLCSEGSCCTPDCGARECGPDPVCGTSCGDCGAGEDCTVIGSCSSGCTPDCGIRVCGPDPVCQVSCGDCPENSSCTTEGQCISGCVADCSVRECGPDPNCDVYCGYCGPDEICNGSGLCEQCIPDCENKTCGDNGCNGVCGTCCDFGFCNDMNKCECEFFECNGVCCDDTDICYQDACCAIDCDNKECGDDGCGNVCGTCSDNASCNQDGICECDYLTCGSKCCSMGQVCYPQDSCCTPDCLNRECGDNGCGDVCGTCLGNAECIDGTCIKECSNSYDCAAPECLACVNGFCVTPPPVCQGANDCCTGYYCSFGTCMPVSNFCYSDDDCLDPGLPFCLNRTCVECTTDDQCDDFFYCKPGDNACAPEPCYRYTDPDATCRQIDACYYCDYMSGNCGPTTECTYPNDDECCPGYSCESYGCEMDLDCSQQDPTCAAGYTCNFNYNICEWASNCQPPCGAGEFCNSQNVCESGCHEIGESCDPFSTNSCCSGLMCNPFWPFCS